MQGLELKTQLHMPCLYNCDLKIGARLVLSYLIYRKSFQDNPSDRQVHLHTGLSRATISEIRVMLESDGWWNDGPTDKLLSFTRNAANKYGYQFIKCFIHQPGQPQSLGSISVWSLLYHYAASGQKPPKVTYSYLDSALGMGHGSAANCLKTLQSDGWLSYTEGTALSFSLRQLNESHLACLANKGQFQDQGESSSITFELTPPAATECQDTQLHTQKETKTTDLNGLIIYLDSRLGNCGDAWQATKERWNSDPDMRDRLFEEEQFPEWLSDLAQMCSPGKTRTTPRTG